MRGLIIITSLLFLFTATQAQETNSIKKAADEKAQAYTAKLMNTLDLSTQQAKAVYRLRYELSIGLQMIHHKYEHNQELMLQFANEAKNDFQVSIKKLLNVKQQQMLNEIKKDIVAKQTNNHPTSNIAETQISE